MTNIRLECLKLANDRSLRTDTLENTLTAAEIMVTWVMTATDGAQTQGTFEPTQTLDRKGVEAKPVESVADDQTGLVTTKKRGK